MRALRAHAPLLDAQARIRCGVRGIRGMLCARLPDRRRWAADNANDHAERQRAAVERFSGSGDGEDDTWRRRGGREKVDGNRTVCDAIAADDDVLAAVVADRPTGDGQQ